MKVSIRNDVDEMNYFPEVFLGLRKCPHCNSSRPTLRKKYCLNQPIRSQITGGNVSWATYECTSCSLPVSLLYDCLLPRSRTEKQHFYFVFPAAWEADEAVPTLPKNYLEQAYQTISSPDASVVMSASAIDAMLKEKGLVEGSLFSRIDQAVKSGILTKDMSDWAHRVRLNSNNPRHADLASPHVEASEAKLSLEFAKALAEVLFVLPSKMPPKDTLEGKAD